MNAIDLLTAQVEQHPTNPIVSAMLVDELMGERDMNRSEAESHVMRVAEVAIDAAFLRRAAELLAGCSWQRAWVRDTLADELPGYVASICTIVLIAGLAPPVMNLNTDRAVHDYWRSYVVTVGAQWLFRKYRELLASRAEHRRDMRQKKRK